MAPSPDEWLEERLGMDAATINHKLDKGLQGKPTRWEGASSFHKKMLKKHAGFRE